jgi:K+-sensing histidine kinase KdpD
MERRVERGIWLETLKWTARTVWGLIICAALAIGSAYLFSTQPWIIFLPFLFVIVIVAVAARYGVMVGLLGSIVSAAIFAHLLFSPLHSLYVADNDARASLAWMVLGGIAIPYLVLPGLRSRSNKK